MNENEFENEENSPDTGEIPVNDKRRVGEDGQRINIEVSDGSETVETPEVLEPAEVKSPEVLKLENALKEIMIRCEAAETKLSGVQVRFEEEKANLEKETAERRERMMKSLEQKAEAGRLDFLSTLLPVLDNLNLAVAAAEDNHSFENLIDGVKGTARSFERALVSVGVETIDSLGKKFDPELHEAVEMVEVDDEEKNGVVTSEYTEGYTFKGRLLRPARVQVGSYTESKEAGE